MIKRTNRKMTLEARIAHHTLTLEQRITRLEKLIKNEARSKYSESDIPPKLDKSMTDHFNRQSSKIAKSYNSKDEAREAADDLFYIVVSTYIPPRMDGNTSAFYDNVDYEIDRYRFEDKPVKNPLLLKIKKACLDFTMSHVVSEISYDLNNTPSSVIKRLDKAVNEIIKRAEEINAEYNLKSIDFYVQGFMRELQHSIDESIRHIRDANARKVMADLSNEITATIGGKNSVFKSKILQDIAAKFTEFVKAHPEKTKVKESLSDEVETWFDGNMSPDHYGSSEEWLEDLKDMKSGAPNSDVLDQCFDYLSEDFEITPALEKKVITLLKRFAREAIAEYNNNKDGSYANDGGGAWSTSGRW